jgi:hypothetical protein
MTDPTADYLAGAASLAADPQRWPRQMAELTDLLADEALRTPPGTGAGAGPRPRRAPDGPAGAGIRGR